MKPQTIIIWLVVALALGGATLFLLNRPRAGGANAAHAPGVIAPGELALDLDPAAVRAMTVRTPDGATQRIERAPTPGEWNLVLSGPGDGAAATTTWPILPTRMRSILTVMSTLRAQAAADPSASLGDNPTTVTLEFDGGATATLRLAERTLGGAGLIEYQVHDGEKGQGEGEGTRRALVGDSFLGVFRSPGPIAWRNAQALPGVGPEASRIRLKNESSTILLVRAAGGAGWRIAEPVRAPADQAKVAQVLSALQGLTITDFLDSRRPDASITRLDAPSATITVETDQRLPAPDPTAPPTVRTATSELHIGGPADSTGRNLFAALGPLADGRTVAIDAATLATVLTTDPAAYIAPTATPTVAADVGTLSLSTDPAIVVDSAVPAGLRRGERRFKRSLGAWADVTADGREAQLADGDTNAVNEVLTFLSTRSAQTTTTKAPEGYTPAGAVVLASLAGAPLDTVEIGTLPSAAIALRSGDVYRVYPSTAAPRLLKDWLTSAGIRVGPAPTPPPAPGEDISK